MEKYIHIQDLELLTLMRQGDQLALKELFDRHYLDLVDQAASRLHEASVYADDIVQQVFIDFWVQRKYEIIEDNVKGYLARMMQFKVASFRRTEVRKRENLYNYLENNSDTPAQEDGEENVLVKLLNEQINQLPQHCREVFIAAYFEDHTYQEVADKFGISKNTVKSHMKTAMAKMKAALKGFNTVTILFFLTTSPFFNL